jgi:isopentenyl diphosphate isomerase/L-lactate dehydrogenase-like FMN-dependent dehydrogenase
MAARLNHIASIADLRTRARRRLPRAVFDFVDGAAGDEETAKANRAAFSSYGFAAPRVGIDVSDCKLNTTILGRPSQLPFGLAPIGFAGLTHPRGEILAARAAAKAGIPFCLSTNSVASIEEVVEAVPGGNNWFQLYFIKDRDWMYKLVARARAAGYSTLCLTLDLAVAGRRDRDVRNAFTVPLRPTFASAMDLAMHLPWVLRIARSPVKFGNFEGNPHSAGFASLAEHVNSLFDPASTWDDVARIREMWDGKLLLKGLIHPDDAARAVSLGTDAISVSNHGGRQLDGAPAAADALVAIRAEVGSAIEVLLDSGIRRGADIIKAQALGASAVLVGRAFVYGLAAAGEAGVDKAIRLLAEEIENNLALIGVPDITELGAEHIQYIGNKF